MASNLTIRELGDNEYPDTQLRYVVCDEIGEVVSAHHWEVDAQKMTALPMLRDALREAYDYIIEVSRQFGIVPEADVTERIVTAIAAAEGE
jgi:hypothetical protein